MKTAYIFHDAFCDPISDWYPWMKTSLEAMGYFVVVPKFPTPAGQSYDSWKAVIKNHRDKFNTETIFIGHGIGGTFALRILEEISVQINGTFLVASYAEALGHEGYDRINETFTKHEFLWEKIKNNTHSIKVFAGENDPFVHWSASEHLTQNLNTTAVIIPGGEHISKASGFTQCVQVLQGIKEGLSEIEKSMVVEPVAIAPIVIEAPVFVRAPDAAFRSDTNVSEKSAPAEEKKTGAETPREPSTVSHTMYQDMSHLVNSNDGKITSSLLKKARTDEAAQKINTVKNPVNGLYIAGTLAVIMAIVGIGMFYAIKIAPAQKNIVVASIASLIKSDSHQKIDIVGKQSYEIIETIRDTITKTPSTGTLHDIYYKKGNLRVSLNSLLENIDITNIPESITGEFIPAGITNQPVFMHGVVNLDTTQAHLIIIPISHYDRAFAGMKEWEPSLFHDVGIFMNIPDSELRTRLDKDTFSDELVNNRPVRTLRNADKKLVLAYFFLNEHTVLITDSLETLPIILTRYTNSQIYQ